MTDHKRDNEDPTVEILRDALGYTDTPDPDTVEMVMTGYDIARLDVVTAELVEETAMVPVRAGESLIRLISAEGGGFRFEFEVRETAPQVVGRLVPIAPGSVALDQIGNQQTQPLDDLGSYEFSLLIGKPFRLRFEPDEGPAVATEWQT
jgi:hypothetical protein